MKTPFGAVFGPATPSRIAVFGLALAVLAGCGTLPKGSTPSSKPVAKSSEATWFKITERHKADDVVMHALGLIDVGYRFGGRNPEAGLDCSGMVSYIYEQTTGLRLPHNARMIAERTRPIGRSELRPGDLVFFNTMNRPYSHVGIYIGDGRFVHAPRTNSRVQIARLDDGYFSSRYEGARTLFPA